MAEKFNAEDRSAGIKKCSGACGRKLPLDAFHLSRSKADGRQSICKRCFSDYHGSANHNSVTQANYRARCYEAEGVITLADWNRIRLRQGQKCNLCLEGDIEFLDHIVPFSQGGSNRLHNVQGLCRGCNTKKNSSERRAAVVHGRLITGAIYKRKSAV